MQFYIWRFRLARARFAERVAWRNRRLTARFYTGSGDATRFESYVARLSPWVDGAGYQRVALRRLAYWLRTPGLSFERSLLRITARFTERYREHRFGRYEGLGAADALKVAWLDEHNDWAAESMGDLSEGDPQHSYIYDEIPVPWSRETETWILGVSQQGFVTASRFDDAGDAWYAYRTEELAIQRSHDDHEPFESYFDTEAFIR